MKRQPQIVLLLVCLLVSISATAQDAQVAKIRKMYAEAKEVMANKKKAELPPDETVVTSNYMAAGAGPIKDVTHYFYTGDFDEYGMFSKGRHIGTLIESDPSVGRFNATSQTILNGHILRSFKRTRNN